MATSYKNPNTGVKENRQKLFKDARRKKKSGASSTASEAQSIAQSLQRTQNLLKGELDRVSQVATAIDEDGKMLQDAQNELQQVNASGAKKALTSLQRAQQHEQRVLMASVAFFFAVVFYIAWQRILIKLPFVERILNMAMKMFWEGVEEATRHGKVGWQLAQAKSQELMDQIQEMIDG